MKENYLVVLYTQKDVEKYISSNLKEKEIFIFCPFNIKDFKVGDKISYAGIPLGSYCSHRNYPTKNLVKVPESIDLEIPPARFNNG